MVCAGGYGGGNASCPWTRVSSEPRSEAGVAARVITSWGRGVLGKSCRAREPGRAELETTSTPCVEQLEQHVPEELGLA